MKQQVLICSGCGKPICEGDLYADLGNDQYCLRCTNTTKIIFKIAEKINEESNEVMSNGNS